MKNIIIDTDPGHDDAIAIMTLMAMPRLIKILGIVTVAGNQTLEKVTKNMLKIAELTGSNIPIAAGSDKPLKRELETGANAHGETGMDGPVLPEPKLRISEKNGIPFMAEKILNSNQKVTILALGPLTNIARLIQEHPETKEHIQEISLMGGGIDKGNITKAAEFNIYVDPEAADIVFSSGLSITMSGLDVTDKAQIYPNEWSVLHGRGSASRFTAELLDFYNIASREFGYTGSAMHDACAAVWLVAPHLFYSEDMHVSVETNGTITRGMTVADKRRIPAFPANVKVLLNVDREDFIKLILDNLLILDNMITKPD